MNLLEVKNIKKSFDDLEVLKDISMSVAESDSRTIRLRKIDLPALHDNAGED